MTRLSFLIVSLLAVSPALAQDASPDDGHNADRAALRKIGALYEQAINNGDLRQLAPYVAPSASAVFSNNDEVQGLDAIQNFFESIKQRLGRNSSYTVALDPDPTEFFDNMAVAHGRSNETAKLGNGRTYQFTTHWTAVLRKDGPTWKALRLQVTMDPFDNPAINARLQMRTIIIGIIAVFVAVIAFFLGGSLRAKAKGV